MQKTVKYDGPNFALRLYWQSKMFKIFEGLNVTYDYAFSLKVESTSYVQSMRLFP
jgi:hypothetical protein